MATPTNVVLDAALKAVAKRRAGERGVSVSAYIRDLIRADDAAARAQHCDLAPLVGLLGSGAEATDIARDKHRIVRQAFDEAFDREQPARAGIE